MEDKLLETKEGKRNKFSLVSARRIEKNKVKSQQKEETRALTKKIDLSVKEKNLFLNKLYYEKDFVSYPCDSFSIVRL